PAALALKPGTAAAGAAQASFTLTAGAALPVGRSLDLVVQGKARGNNADKVVTRPALAPTGRRPVTVRTAAGDPGVAPARAGGRGWGGGGRGGGGVSGGGGRGTWGGGRRGGPRGPAPRRGRAGRDESRIELGGDAKVPAAAPAPALTCSTTVNGMPPPPPPV